MELSLLGVGTVLRFERDAWSMFNRLLRQATNEYALPPPPSLAPSPLPHVIHPTPRPWRSSAGCSARRVLPLFGDSGRRLPSRCTSSWRVCRSGWLKAGRCLTPLTLSRLLFRRWVSDRFFLVRAEKMRRCAFGSIVEDVLGGVLVLAMTPAENLAMCLAVWRVMAS